MTPEQFEAFMAEVRRFNDNIEAIANVILAEHEDENGLVPAAPRPAHHAKAPGGP